MTYSDILTGSRIGVMDKDTSIGTKIYYTMKGDENDKGLHPDMVDLIHTRPIYPSDKKTFAINKIKSSDKIIDSMSIYFNITNTVDVNVMLEDSKRN